MSSGFASNSITITNGAARAFFDEFAARAGGDVSILVADSNTLPLAQTLLPSSMRVLTLELPEGEAAKEWNVLGELFTKLMKSGEPLNRNTFVIGFGGGCVGDVAAMLAALFKRGLPLVQIPTSLLAMVDASVGGKAAVNHAGVKNAIGVFKFPEQVVIDPTLLATLPKRHFSNGMAEAIKMGATLDTELFEYCEATAQDKYGLKEHLPTIVRRSVEVKSRVVEEDPQEGGVRRVLNFGHTLGHALESLDSDLLHGEAVAIGITWAMRVAVELGVAELQWAKRLNTALESFDLPTGLKQPLESSSLLDRMKRDKKRVSAGVEMIFSPEVGAHATQVLGWDAIEELLTFLPLHCGEEAHG